MLGTTYPLASVCRVLGLPHSTLYYQAQPREDREVRQAIEAVAQPFPTYVRFVWRMPPYQRRRWPHQGSLVRQISLFESFAHEPVQIRGVNVRT